MLKKVLFAVVIVFAGLGGYGWYFLYGPVKGIQPRPPLTSEAVAETPAVSATPEAEQDVVEPYISVDPSTDTIETFPATVTVHDGDKTYVTHYTGQLRRTKRFLIEIKTYDIASYVTEMEPGKTLDLLDDLLQDGTAKVFMLRFISALPGRQISNDIYDEINDPVSFGDVDLVRLQHGIDTFCQQFSVGSHRGDIVYIVWLPNGKVYSGFNTADKLNFIGQDIPFARALWRIWVGPKYGDNRFNLVRRYADDKPMTK